MHRRGIKKTASSCRAGTESEKNGIRPLPKRRNREGPGRRGHSFSIALDAFGWRRSGLMNLTAKGRSSTNKPAFICTHPMPIGKHTWPSTLGLQRVAPVRGRVSRRKADPSSLITQNAGGHLRQLGSSTCRATNSVYTMRRFRAQEDLEINMRPCLRQEPHPP